MANPYKLTATHRRNLTKLADKLDSLKPRYGRFNMRWFVEERGANGEQIEKYARKNGGLEQFECGTMACAIGHGPAAGILMRDEEFQKARWDYRTDSYVRPPDWIKYTKRFIPIDSTRDGAMTGEKALFEFLFGGGWADVDNHHYGAAARIRYILDGNEIPETLQNCRNNPRPRDKKWYRAYDKRYNRAHA